MRWETAHRKSIPKTDTELTRFLRDAKCSGTEMQGTPQVASDQKSLSRAELKAG